MPKGQRPRVEPAPGNPLPWCNLVGMVGVKPNQTINLSVRSSRSVHPHGPRQPSPQVMVSVRWREETMNMKRRIVLFASCAVFAAVVGPVAAIAPPPPEYGLRGVRRVELVFMNVGKPGIASMSMPADGVIPPTPANEDLAIRALAKDQECMAIGPMLAREGLDVVDRCRADDLACAKLFLSVEDQGSGGSSDRLYLIEIALSQRVRLARDPKVDLSIPTTWSMHQVASVAADHSATITSCISLRDMATWFASVWKVENK